MSTSSRMLAGAGVLLLLVSACGRSEPRAVGTTTVTSARVSGADEAVMWLTSTRCDREVACGNVGVKRTFVDREACNRERGRDTTAVLGANVCTQVNEDKVTNCWLALRRVQCDTDLPSLHAVDACRREDLCAR